MNCKGTRSKLSAYIDGELSGYEMLAIRSHVHDCAECSCELEELRRLKCLIGSLPESDPDEEFVLRLKARVRGVSALPRRPSPVYMLSGLAFTAALALTLASIHGRNNRGEVSAPVPVAAKSSNFELARDQAYQSGGDPFSDGSMVITVSSTAHGHP